MEYVEQKAASSRREISHRATISKHISNSVETRPQGSLSQNALIKALSASFLNLHHKSHNPYVVGETGLPLDGQRRRFGLCSALGVTAHQAALGF